MLFNFICLLILLGFGSSKDIKCNFDHYDWAIIGERYTCAPDILSISVRENVTSISGSNKPNKTNADIEALHIHQGECFYFPSGFASFFTKIIGLSIQEVHLKELTSSDLQPFPELKILFAHNNDLEVLEKKTFIYNLNLEVIHLNDNKIHSVGLDILKPLKRLASADFRNNTCISLNAKSRVEVEELNSELKKNCLSRDLAVSEVLNLNVEITKLESKIDQLEILMNELVINQSNNSQQIMSHDSRLQLEIAAVKSAFDSEKFKYERELNSTASQLQVMMKKFERNISESLQDILSKIRNIDFKLSELSNKTNDKNIDELECKVLDNSKKIQRSNQFFTESYSESNMNLANFQIEFNDALNHIVNLTNLRSYSLRQNDENSGISFSISIILIGFVILCFITALFALILFRKMKKLQNMVIAVHDF